MKFVVTLSEDEDGFIASSCPALPGCHSQGRTPEEAVSNIKEAIEAYVESMVKRGEPLPDYSELREIVVAI